MTRQHGGNDDAPVDITALPNWTPEPVRRTVQTIEQQNWTFDYRPILRRLAFDVRMKRVWSELLKKKTKSGDFAHQARRQDDSDQRTNHDLQFAAMRELLLYVIIVAFEKRPVAKPKEIEAARNTALRYEQALRNVAGDMALAMTRGELGLTETFEIKQLADNDRLALLRVADWYAKYVQALRKPNDPLMVAKHRDDPIQRGVHISIANKLNYTFGRRLDRTAATLASVALGVKIGVRPARSALSKKAPSKTKARKSPKRK
jgi:hypothetical protein